MRRALVTGAAGFIGCHLVEALATTGTEVVGIDNERSGDWTRLRVPCERVARDLTELTIDDLRALCHDVDVVFHLAAEKYNSRGTTPARIIDVNIAATDRLFTAAALAGAGKVVFTSSLYAYGSLGPAAMHEDDLPGPTTRYGVSKLAGEHLLRAATRDHGLRWTSARLFFIYGPRQYAEGGYKSVIVANFERIRRGEPPTIYGDGAQALDYVFVDDAVEALLACAAADVDGEVVNVASGRAINVNELTHAMLAAAGSHLEPVTSAPDWTAGTRRVGDPARAAQRLGWKASVGIEEGVARVWQWMTGSHG